MTEVDVDPRPGDALLIATGVTKQLVLPDGSSSFTLEPTDLSLPARTVTAIVGHSGSGKTTLLQICGLLTKPDSGTVRILGVDSVTLSGRQRARTRRDCLGFVFQSFNLAPQLSALDNVILGANAPRTEARKYALDLLSQIGLERQSANRPAELSAGEQQRVAFARSMINRAPVILADEPTGNLDEQNEVELMQRFRGYADQGNAVLLVTHSESVAAQADVVLRMANGEIIS